MADVEDTYYNILYEAELIHEVEGQSIHLGWQLSHALEPVPITGRGMTLSTKCPRVIKHKPSVIAFSKESEWVVIAEIAGRKLVVSRESSFRSHSFLGPTGLNECKAGSVLEFLSKTGNHLASSDHQCAKEPSEPQDLHVNGCHICSCCLVS